VRFGVPVTDFDTVFVGIGAESTDRRLHRHPEQLLPVPRAVRRQQPRLPLTLGWARDARDSALAPTAGSYQRVNFEWGFAGDVRYLRTNLQYQEYWPLPWKMSLG
jgi:outer membrane protein insertion porin family